MKSFLLPSLLLLLTPLLLSANESNQGLFLDKIFGANARQGIAATAEGRVVTYEDIRRELRPLMSQLRMQYPDRRDLSEAVRELAMDIRQTLVDRILVRNEFDRLGFQIPTSYIDNRLNEILILEFDGDRQRRHEFLQARGMTMQEYREDLENKIVVEVMRGRLERSQSMISPVRIQQYYEDNQDQFVAEERILLHIIRRAPTQEEDPEDVLRSLASNAERIRGGTEINEVFPRVGSARWYSRSDLRPEIAEIAFELEPGGVSQPFAQDGAFFLFVVEERAASGVKPLNKVRDEIEQILVDQNSRIALREWIQQLRSRSYVRYFDF